MVNLTNKLKEIIENSDESESVLITGDLKICHKGNPNNQVSRELRNMVFQQLISTPTDVQGGQIDHVYWRNKYEKWTIQDVEMYSPYYSDHDASLITQTGWFK